MFKINNKIYEDSKTKFNISTVYTKNKEIKVIDLLVSYTENGVVKNHFFEGIERFDYLKGLEVGHEIISNNISAYLCYENNDLAEKGIDLNNIIDLEENTDVVIKSKKISEDGVKVTININNEKLNLECDATINI